MHYSGHAVFGWGTLLGWVSILRTLAGSLLKAKTSQGHCCAVLCCAVHNPQGTSYIPSNQRHHLELKRNQSFE